MHENPACPPWFHHAHPAGDDGHRHPVRRIDDIGWTNDKAILWYERAARQGHAEAINNLGIAYQNGSGVPQDPVIARALYILSLSLDDTPENKAHLNLDASTELLSNQQQETADKLAIRMRQTTNLDQIIDTYFE